MTGEPTTQYDKMFPGLLSRILGKANVVGALHEQFKTFAVWVSDQDFEQALIDEPAYRRNDLAFSRMLLIELDRRFQTHGQLPDYSTVSTIEHVMPQTLDESWKHYLGEDAHNDQLEEVVDTIGNLCLLSRPANSAVGQDPFVSKKGDYSPLTALARQIKEYNGHWKIAAIRERSGMLAKKALEVWPWAKV